MTNDGMTPVITVTDAESALLVVTALVGHALELRQAARHMSEAFDGYMPASIGRVVADNIRVADKLTALANEVERQMGELECGQ